MCYRLSEGARALLDTLSGRPELANTPVLEMRTRQLAYTDPGDGDPRLD